MGENEGPVANMVGLWAKMKGPVGWSVGENEGLVANMVGLWAKMKGP